MSGVIFFVWLTLWIFVCFLAASVVQLRRRPPCRRDSSKEEGRRTCGSKAEVSVFDFRKPEQRAVLFFWSGCFQYPRESGDGNRIGRNSSGKLQAKQCRRSRGKLQAGHCPKQSPKPRNAFSSVERRHTVSKELRETASLCSR